MRFSTATTRRSPARGAAANRLIAGTATAVLLVAAMPAPALPPGGDGVRITIPVSGTGDSAYAAVLDGDGNVVMAGATSNGSAALASITRAGQLDIAFGTNGVVVYDISTSTDSLRGLARMGDGRYVGCGTYFSPGTANDFVVARFLEDGSFDTTFDGVGYAVTPFLLSGPGGSLFDQCNAVAVANDGSIVSAGLSFQDGPSRVALTRHTADGALDESFGLDGKLVIDASQTSNGNSEARAVLIQPDGKILIAGYAGGQFNSDFLVMRLDADGTRDAGFGTNGVVRTPVDSGEDVANTMVLQPDGRIVLAGTSVIPDNRHDFALARYNANGTLDATFGVGGLVTTPIGPGDDVAYALALMPWGRLVAAGSSRISTSAAGSDLSLVAYNADGTLDRYFGDLGLRTIAVSTPSDADDIAYALVNDIAGEHFWAIGTATPVSNGDFLAIELGLPDTIFRHGFDSNTAP